MKDPPRADQDLQNIALSDQEVAVVVSDELISDEPSPAGPPVAANNDADDLIITTLVDTKPVVLDDGPFCVHITSSQDLLEDSPMEKAVPPPPADDTARAAATPDDDMKFLLRLSTLNCGFPPPVRGEFQPSEFQRAVLDDIHRKRIKFGHKHGLSIMATAVGKVRFL